MNDELIIKAQKRLEDHDKAYENTIWLKEMLIEAFKEIRNLQTKVIDLDYKINHKYE